MEMDGWMVNGALLDAEGSESDHSPPSRITAENIWSYTSTLTNVFMLFCLDKHRDNCTLSWRERYI